MLHYCMLSFNILCPIKFRNQIIFSNDFCKGILCSSPIYRFKEVIGWSAPRSTKNHFSFTIPPQ